MGRSTRQDRVVKESFSFFNRFFQILSILCRTDTILFLEYPTKIEGVIVSYDLVFIAIFTLLQFPDDLSEQHFVIRQCATVKNVLVQGDSVIVQDVFDIISCKVNPEHLWMIFYIINILLDFFRLVKHHVSSSHHFLNTIEPKVRFT